MKLRFRRYDSLPALAWCAVIYRGADYADIFHGPWVESTDTFFCEGAWSGDFQLGDFNTTMLMGTGGISVGKQLLIAAPNHTLERLFVLKKGKKLFVSNSFAFVLASAGDNVDPGALLYSVKMASITQGLNGYARSLPTRAGNKVWMYYHCNLLIDSNLNVIEEPKQAVREFRNYADYKSFLLEKVREIHDNANDPRRKVAYRPVATISSGYDSPAAAVMAKSIGCAEALTFEQARDEQNNQDSGAEIAAKLGMKTRIFDRLDYLKERNFPEAEFFGYGAQESPWAAHLKATLLFTGHYGGMVWNRLCKKVDPYVTRGDPSGHNLGEFRLRAGWIHLPVPFLGCTSHPSIHKITTSQEMEPWTLNNNYDRPIPRRLVEEAGVERHLFGMKKNAVGLSLHTEGLKERITRESYDDYVKYYHQHWNAFMAMKQRLCIHLRRFNQKCDRLDTRINPLALIPRDLRIGRFGDLDQLSLLVHWSTEKILPRYKIDI